MNMQRGVNGWICGWIWMHMQGKARAATIWWISGEEDKKSSQNIYICSKCISQEDKIFLLLACWLASPCKIIDGNCHKYGFIINTISLLVYFLKGQYLWLKFLVQNLRTSDYLFGGFCWKHEPHSYHMTLWCADNNFRNPDTSYFNWVDRWGESDMMMPRSLAKIQQDDVWCKHVSWAGNSTAHIFIVIRQLFWLLLQICLQKSFVVCDTCKRNYALFDRLITIWLATKSSFQHWWKHWHMPSVWQDLEKLPARASFCAKASDWVTVWAFPVWGLAAKRVCLARPSLVQDAQGHSRSPFKRWLQRVWIILKPCEIKRVGSDWVKCLWVSRTRIESWKISARTKTFFMQFENFVWSFPTGSAEVRVKSQSSKSFPEISLSLRNCKPASQLW